MHDPQSKNDLIEQLRAIQQSLADSVQKMSSQEFNAGTDVSWSASGYLQHLILSVKPFAKALKLPPDQIEKLFGQPDHPSRSYAEVVKIYKARLGEGIRAEDFTPVTPITYRFPEGTEDRQRYLVETWNDSNNRLLEALGQWSEEDLDTHQIPHPAIGLITVREMLFFTVYHNTLHWHDIEEAPGKATG